MKALLALAVGFTCSSASAPKPSVVDYSPVVQVRCNEGSGTAFRIGYHRFLSVAHVAKLTDCTINNRPVTKWLDEGNDFAVLDADVDTEGKFEVNCEGFKTGTYAWAIGYAGGNSWQTMVVDYVTYRKWRDGKRMLLGSQFISGMSGGPVLNEKGEVVGLVNAYLIGFPISLSRDLKDTGLCSHS